MGEYEGLLYTEWGRCPGSIVGEAIQVEQSLALGRTAC